MNDSDMGNLMNQINSMLKNNEIPSELKNLVNNIKNSSNDEQTSGSDSKSNENTDTPDIDINTILKMKQVMDSMKSNKDDPRANLLLSLKPYLKKSRQQKVDQYVKLFGLGKAFEAFNFLGGENKNDV